MEDNKKVVLFEQAAIPKAVMSMAIPTVISSLVMVIYNMADTYFVGIINDPVQNAAVTLAAPVLLAFNAVNNLFGVGCSSLMSRELGKREYKTVKQVSAFGFYCSVLSGLLFSFVYFMAKNPLLIMLGTDSETYNATQEYLNWTVGCGAAPAILNIVMAYMFRSEGATLHASIGTMSGCILNIILDPIFILPWGFNMGAAGAGFATFISNCFACMYFFVLIFLKRKSTYVSISPHMVKLKKYIILGICAVGIPASIQNLLNVTGMTVLNNFTSSYGSDAVAAMGIAQKVNMVPMYIALGFSQGVMPLIGYNYSSGNIDRMKEALIFSMKITVIFIAAIAVGYYFGAEYFIRLFMDNDKIVNYGAAFLKGMCFALVFLNIDFMAVGVFQATGMGKMAFLFAILRKIVMEIPAIIILNMLIPLYGLAYAQTVTEIILAVAAVIVLKNIFNKLYKNVDRER